MTLLIEDKVLREGYKRGERAALTKIYDEYGRSVFSFLIKGFSFGAGAGDYYFRGYRDSWQLENAVQEVFTRAFSENARLAYDGLRPFKNYLFTIARNLVIDNKRKSSREFVALDELPEKQNEGAMVDAGQPIADPEKAAQEKQLKRDVAQFVSQLSGQERSLFDMRFRDGRSIEAAAGELKVTEHWIKKEEKKIKKRFFHWMRERGYFEGFRHGEKKARGGMELMLMMLALNGA